MKIRSTVGVLLFSIWAAAAFGQIELAQKVVPGQSGRPLLISDAADQLVEPITVYSNSDTELLSPDFTKDSWILSNFAGFEKGEKQYGLMLTVFYKNDNSCRHTRIPADHSNDADFLAACHQLRYSQVGIVVDLVAETISVEEGFGMNKNGAVGLDLFGANLLRSYPRATLALKNLGQYSNYLNPAVTLISKVIEREMKERAPLLIGAKYPERLPFISPNYHAGEEVYAPYGMDRAPVILSGPVAELSTEARREHYQGTCILAIVVDEQGNPQNPLVIRPLGKGLDEKALEAVRKYKFKPAMKGDKPVAAGIQVGVKFSYEGEAPTHSATATPGVLR